MQWIQACKTEHSKCGTESSAQVPAVLIDFGSSQDSEIVRLIESDQGKYDYITLSHRWGGAQSGITTTKNFVERLSGFRQDQLPLNFRDAISITRHLKYCYLWIDCLCIRQGSQEDWERQCSQMAAIYRGSSLTITAAAARNSHAGILHPRPGPSPSSSCILEHRDDDGLVKG
jgi:Heterokaryon incompatibility protein (HET)